MNALLVAPCPRRQFLAAGVLFWTTLALSWANDVSLKELRLTCRTATPTPTYTVEMTVVNGMDCPMGWITLHSNETFSPHIINLNTSIAPGGEANFTTTLTGPASGSTHAFVLMSHCLRDGEICNPCRLDIKLELPFCDPTIDPPNPRPERPRSPRVFGLEKDRFFISLPTAPTPVRYVVEASEDMATWKPIATSMSANGAPSMDAIDANEDSPEQTVWVTKEKAKHCLFYRVREVPTE